MATTHLRQVWDRGDTALGAFLFFREPLIAEAAALAGYDYVCVDMQHGLQSFEHTVTMLYAMARTETTPIVRVPWNEPSIIGRVDAGAYGVIVPMVNTVEEACAVVAACRYAPEGSRSMGPVGVSARAGREGYFSTANSKVLCIPMIETKEAVGNVDEIAAVPGIDALVHLGPRRPVDHLRIGTEARPGRRRMERGDRTGEGGVRAQRRDPSHPRQAGLAEKRRSAGWKMITVGFDLGNVMSGLRSQLKEARGD